MDLPQNSLSQFSTSDVFHLEPGKAIRGGQDGVWYKNIAFLGKGGNGVTFLVLCTGGKYRGQIFALKVLYKMSIPKRIERFLQEIDFLKEQIHPSIIQHYDDGQYERRPFVVMNYLPNTLAQEIKKGISISKALIYTNQLLSSLKLLQDNNILHRDIKPQNIFINSTTALLGDFGLIKRLDSSTVDEDDKKFMIETFNGEAFPKKAKENTDDIKGYVAMPFFYRTPELIAYARGTGSLHLKSDIFQLGLVLAEMFTGKNPLQQTTNILDKIKLNPIGKIQSKYGSRIVKSIKKMIKLDSEDRAGVDELLADFTGIYMEYADDKFKLDGNIF